MPKTTTKKEGVQVVPKYTYPRGEILDGYEKVSRHGWFETAAPGPNQEQTFKTTDGLGVLPVDGQPNTMSLIMSGLIGDHQYVTFWFRRPAGTTGPYTLVNVVLDGPAQERRPFTIAR